MIYFARLYVVITPTGGEVFDVVKVEAATGAEAVEKICSAKRLPAWRVYLTTEEDAASWAALGIAVKEI
jgi:hypothetical protein